MINAISNWAGGIVIAVIVVTILEMILPEGKNKKYIKTVLGIYLLFTVISPIIKVVSGEELNINNILEMENYTNVSNSKSIETSSSILNVYEDNLKKDMKNKLEQKGYVVSQIKLILESDDEENYGKIYEIKVALEREQSKETNNRINKVENVQIVIGETLEDKKEIIPDKEKQEVKEYLSENYNVEESKITIF